MGPDRDGAPGTVGDDRAVPALSAIVASGLVKRYGAIAAVDRLDLSVGRGELYGFLGPNGAGKTTTIRMALGLIFPSEGEIGVLGEPLFPPSQTGGRRRMLAAPAPLRQVGALVEEPGFWKYLTGRTNLAYFARAAGPRQDRDRRLRRVDDVLRLVGLEAAAGKRVKAYSQGMRQRLGIALAVLGSPDVLVLDEPTNGLDPQGMREVRVLLRRLADEGTTVFVSSHLLWEVEAMCDRVGVLARGKVVAEGAPGELRTTGDVVRIEVDDPQRANRVLKRLRSVALLDGDGTGGRAVADRTLRLRVAPPTTPADVNGALVAGGVRVSALIPERATLEDVFLQLTEGADAPR
ncbi:MAG: ABC transporter ATP-binding protein [Actinomycetota bacterium]